VGGCRSARINSVVERVVRRRDRRGGKTEGCERHSGEKRNTPVRGSHLCIPCLYAAAADFLVTPGRPFPRWLHGRHAMQPAPGKRHSSDIVLSTHVRKSKAKKLIRIAIGCVSRGPLLPPRNSRSASTRARKRQGKASVPAEIARVQF